MKKSVFYTMALIWGACVSCSPRVDVLVIGGGASGTAAAVQAAKMGANTMVTEEFTWLGGMLTSAGVSAVDGNYRIRSGIYDSFVDSLSAHYGSEGALCTGWVSNVLFEPHVGDEIFKKMAAHYDNLDIRYETVFVGARKNAKGWTVTLKNADGSYEVRTKVLIDATELGDVAKTCGVPYEIGMDSRYDTGEDIAPEKENDVIQDLTMCMTLKDYGPNADRSIERPADYDSTLYLNSCINPLNHDIYFENGTPIRADVKLALHPVETMLTYGKLPVTGPDAKYMINWPAEGNDVYVNVIEAAPERRKEALDSCKNISLGFLYFIQHELGYKNLGLADDEYPTEDLLPMIPYHRESRRIDGMVRFTVDAAARPYEYKEPLYRTGIGSGNYPVDHHHFRNADWPSLPDLHFYPIPSYNLPMGVVLPKEVQDLIVAEKSVSVTNLVNGTTRLQPMTLQIGQASGALAALAVKNGGLDKVKVRQLQDVLLEEGVYIMPYQDLDNRNPKFGAEQRIGATGILRGLGRPHGWANETWFRVNDPLKADEIFFEELYPQVKVAASAEGGQVTVSDAYEMLAQAGAKVPDAKGVWSQMGLDNYCPDRVITRLEFAVMLDHLLDPFHAKEVDYHGHFVE